MGLQENKGLPVGNLTSQFFANIYLNHLDHYIKHELGYRAYVRYMDDFVLWCDDSESLKRDLKQIELFLYNELALQIKAKSTQINRTAKGLPFLGYRVFPKLLSILRTRTCSVRTAGLIRENPDFYPALVRDKKNTGLELSSNGRIVCPCSKPR